MRFLASNQCSEINSIILRFETKELLLNVNKNKLSGEKSFNGDDFGIEGNHGSSPGKKVLFWVFLQVFHQCFNA